MTMFYSFHENLDISEEETPIEFVPSPEKPQPPKSDIHLFAEKLRVPVFENRIILRPRLNELLAKTLAQFGSTLITGRAGTGKTALAADFARRYKKISWYSVGSSEMDWKIFSRYFVTSFNEKSLVREFITGQSSAPEDGLEEIAYFTENVIGRVSAISPDDSRLIILDDTHYLFDSEWFTTFFYSLISSLPPNIHFIMLCRGTPSLPLWRLRSKQVLGVIDEKNLNFNLRETRDLLNNYGISPEKTDQFYRESFGRISKLKRLAGQVRKES